ncbi:hypothetical protein EYC80_008860 [Monilinia laxa]|uniref:Uncharacterized protein n=1 Tax=Monilinia laxa TaxID=61186 RepID=A0A5N6K1Q6_MONLA|nr:hypothetical protein EYC80_008860 [Monilinia laxa]
MFEHIPAQQLIRPRRFWLWEAGAVGWGKRDLEEGRGGRRRIIWSWRWIWRWSWRWRWRWRWGWRMKMDDKRKGCIFFRWQEKVSFRN